MLVISRRTWLCAFLFFCTTLSVLPTDIDSRPVPIGTKVGFGAAAGLGVAAVGVFALTEHLLSKQGDTHHNLTCRLDGVPLYALTPADLKALADSHRKLKRLKNWQKVSYWLAGGAAVSGAAGLGFLYVDSQKAQAEAETERCHLTVCEDSFARAWQEHESECAKALLIVDSNTSLFAEIRNSGDELHDFGRQLGYYMYLRDKHQTNRAALALVSRVGRRSNEKELSARRVKRSLMKWHPDKGAGVGVKLVKYALLYKAWTELEEKVGEAGVPQIEVGDPLPVRRKVCVFLNSYMSETGGGNTGALDIALKQAKCSAQHMAGCLNYFVQNIQEFAPVIEVMGSGAKRQGFLKKEWDNVSKFLNEQTERIEQATQVADGFDDTKSRMFYRWLTGRGKPFIPISRVQCLNDGETE